MSANVSQQPLVSVYIPTHDREALLARAIRSVLAQTYPAIELIVVDDASSDGTPALLEQLAREHPQLRFFRHEEPKGACAARNLAIDRARGRFVTGLDDDDEFVPERVAKLVAAHEDRFAFVCSRDIVQHGDRRVIHNPKSGVITLGELLHYNCAATQALVLRERMLEVGGYDEQLPALQDYDLWVRLCARFGDAKKLSEVLYVTHVEHTAQRISGSPERRVRAHARFVEKHAALMSPAHRQSMQLLRKTLGNERLSMRDYLRLVNRDNAVAATALLVNSSPPWLVALKNRVVGALSERRARG